MNKVCIVMGVGPGNGEAFVRRFSDEGYQVAMLARSKDYLLQLEQSISNTYAFPCDLMEPEQIGSVLASIRDKLGPASVLLYNAGGGVFKSVEDASLEDFEANWRINVQGLVAATKAILPQLREHDSASIVVTSASAATRGRANTAPFASAKAAQRSLAQSMARQLGPEKIHVASVVIDGVVDLPRTREALADKPDDFFVKPAAVADAVWNLCQQHPSAWTFELDIRPFGETW
ncbi:SDR family NAD(P)-dependent oxidoreductase [Marinobacter sp.]|uniref:SDR family NAD(P)-dependent oxidoreductase n=1 Tax=Marinobacter sp. TaxID=50741 RepID=UPI000C6A00CE|nr:SDR family NAD(P)-dependent oxidoreductase [Marinobacter sp.]MBE95176.1 short-chain dehydrogenase [Marinobacter sp.]MBP54213.1 short-chain dehydrogenase [Marinobacter sp.]|tara:strand:- start:5852 stop:6550 length:699 start_codon:yes stop_codon:yes gene_type:complete